MGDTHETARLTADVVLLGEQDGQEYVLLIERGYPPYAGCWALPGGFVNTGEDVEDAGRRELAEEAGVEAGRLDLVGVYSAPGRDPRCRSVTWAYVEHLGTLPSPTAGDDARNARWCLLSEVLDNPGRLAFDHDRIVRDAVAHIQGVHVRAAHRGR